MADGLGKKWSLEVQKIVNEAFELFAPMVHPEWLLWSSELLFSDLQEAVKCELWEVEEKQWLEEEEAEAVKKKVEEEEAR
jgi:hypothetical protein